MCLTNRTISTAKKWYYCSLNEPFSKDKVFFLELKGWMAFMPTLKIACKWFIYFYSKKNTYKSG